RCRTRSADPGNGSPWESKATHGISSISAWMPWLERRQSFTTRPLPVANRHAPWWRPACHENRSHHPLHASGSGGATRRRRPVVQRTRGPWSRGSRADDGPVRKWRPLLGRYRPRISIGSLWDSEAEKLCLWPRVLSGDSERIEIGRCCADPYAVDLREPGGGK